MTYILDATAKIAFLRRESGWEVVRDLLSEPAHTCVAHGVNLCEVYYAFMRAGGEVRARSAIQDLYAAGVSLREDLDTPFWQEAGQVRAVYGVPFADSFCVALARRLKGELITCDHKDFDPIAPLGLCRIRFIR